MDKQTAKLTYSIYDNLKRQKKAGKKWGQGRLSRFGESVAESRDQTITNDVLKLSVMLYGKPADKNHAQEKLEKTRMFLYVQISRHGDFEMAEYAKDWMKNIGA